MKKVLSVFLAVSMLLTLSVMLVSCAHTCEFSTEWSKDASSHWHACTKKDCAEIADKADHTWHEGKVTTKATQEADGVKTFTCSVCAQTKTEPIAFTGLSQAEWDAAFEDAVFENFAYMETAVTTGSGVSVDTETQYKFTQDTAWAKMVAAGQSQESYAPDTLSANQARKQLVDSIKALAPYGSFQYDAATKTYKAKTAITITSLNASTSDITLTFANEKLVEIKYTVSFTQNNISFSATSTITLSDYGTVVLKPPAS